MEPIQKELYHALKNKSDEVAQMYLGAVHVFNQKDNPSRISLAAHGIREMMTRLPKVIDVPISDGSKQRLGDFMRTLSQVWAKLCKKNRWPGNPKWDGTIDTELKTFLNKIESLLEADSRIKSDRSAVTQSFIRKQNFSSVALPDEIEKLKVDEWLKYQDYFVRTAHFNPTDEASFLKYLKHFESVLFGYLEPRTFETQDEILNLIKQGESDAN